MAYNLVDFNKSKSDVTADRQQQERFREFNPQEFDRTVVAALRPLVKEAVRIEEDVHKRIGDEYGRAKRLMDQMEALAKKKGKKFAAADANLVGVMTRTIEDAKKAADQASADAAHALGQWRGAVTAGWPDLFSNRALFDKEIAPRAKTLKYGPGDEVLRKRLAEYVTRAKNIQKLAQQSSTRGAVQAQSDDVAIGDFTRDASKYLADIKRDALRATNELDMFVTKPLTKATQNKQRAAKADVKTWEGGLATVEQKAKGVRGQLKTFEVLLATFKKRAGMFDDASRKDAQKAYSDATKQLKEAATKAKELASLQSKVAKALAQAKKTAK